MRKREFVMFAAVGLVIIVIVVLAYYSQIRGHSIEANNISIVSVSCSSSQSRCTFSVANTAGFDISTAGSGTISQNNTQASLSCGVVNLKSGTNTSVSCVVQGNPPSSGTHVLGSLALSNGQNVPFAADFTS